MVDVDPNLVNGISQLGLGGIAVLVAWIFKMMFRLHKRIDSVNRRLDAIANRQDHLSERLNGRTDNG